MGLLTAPTVKKFEFHKSKMAVTLLATFNTEPSVLWPSVL